MTKPRLSTQIAFNKTFGALDPVGYLQGESRRIARLDNKRRRAFVDTYKEISASLDQVQPSWLGRAAVGRLNSSSEMLLGVLFTLAIDAVSQGKFDVAQVETELPLIRKAIAAHPDWPFQLLEHSRQRSRESSEVEKHIWSAAEDARHLARRATLYRPIELDSDPGGGAGGSGSPPDGGAEGGGSGGALDPSHNEGGDNEWVWGLPFWALAVLAGIGAFFP